MAEPKEILNKVLQEIAIEQNFVNYDLKVELISSGGANYTSTLYNVTLSESGKFIYMFAKVAAIGEKMRTQAPKLYNTEVFAYTKLAKIYKQLEDEHNISQEHRLTFCKLYGCNTKSYEETIVLENLFKTGYEAYDRFKSMSKAYAFSAIRELAKFHALSFAFAEYYPEEFNAAAVELKFVWDTEDEAMKKQFEQIIIRAIATVKEEFREPLQKFIQALPQDAYLDYMTPTKRAVLGHGDYRPNNLMHRSREDGTVEIKIVDLQTLQASGPITDLLYFIITGTDEEFREQYYEQVIDHYYTHLHAAMKRLQLDPEKVYSRADFDYELKKKLPFSLVNGMMALMIVTVDEENAPKVNEDLSVIDFFVVKTSDLYKERVNGLVNDYVKWGILK